MRDVEAFGVYVHWPFCLSKCPYCDFNSHVRHSAIDEARYVRAFAREIAATAERVGGRTVTTIFMGGGTPSLMQPATVGAILDAIGQHWTVAPDVEVTLEANPTSVEATRFAGYRAAGVNRVSLGVQALDDASLKELGRLHTAQEALDAVAIARKAFERYSFDLIYARPGQTTEAWRTELSARDRRGRRTSLALSAHHRARHAVRGAACERQACHSRRRQCARALRRDAGCRGRARAAGLRDFKPRAAGAECRHNLVYWRYHEYAGIGPGAHGRLMIDGARHATATEKRPESWLMRVEANGHGLVTDETLTRVEQADEYLLMGLRLAEGIDPQRYAAFSGHPLDEARIAALGAEGMVERTPDGRLRVTRAGFPVLDAVVADLAA